MSDKIPHIANVKGYMVLEEGKILSVSKPFTQKLTNKERNNEN